MSGEALKADDLVGYLSNPPDGGNRYWGSEYSRAIAREAAARIIAVEAERDCETKRADSNYENIVTGLRHLSEAHDRAAKAEARIAVLEALVELAFKDGVQYGSLVSNADPEISWRQSKVRASLNPEPS